MSLIFLYLNLDKWYNEITGKFRQEVTNLAKELTAEEKAAERQKGILDGLEEIVTDYKAKKTATAVPKPADPKPADPKPAEGGGGFLDFLFGK